MKRKRHIPEEVIRKLRTAEEAVAGGRTVEEASLIMAVSMATFQRWKGRYSGVKTDTTTADRIHRWTIGHPPDSRLQRLNVTGLGRGGGSCGFPIVRRNAEDFR
jgi:hypothetical protein